MNDFILKIPKWEGSITFSDELITLILVIIALVAGVLLCFWGYRYFQTIALVLLGCGCGVIGYRIGSRMTVNEILRMSIFVMFTFLGVCICYFLSILWTSMTKKMGIQFFLQRTMHIIASLTGAILVGVVTCTQVYSNWIVALVITVIFAAAGIWHGIRSMEAKRVFHTYEDLVNMKPLTEEEADA